MTNALAAHRRALRQTLSGLAAKGVIPAAAAHLEATHDAAAQALATAVLAEIPAFTASGNPDVLPGLQRHVRDHVVEITRLLGGGEIGDFAFVRDHAALRAEQRFPLEVMLHAYRCGHRSQSRWLREAVQALALAQPDQAIAAVADFSIEYTDAISTIAAAEYVARTRLLAAAETDRRVELLSTLLAGYDESDQRVAQLLKRAGYLEQRQSYCVVLAQAVNPAEMESPERAQRIVEAITDVLAATSIRVLIGVRNNLVTAILSDRRRQSGWTEPQASLAARAKPQLLLLGPAVVASVSADHPSTAFIPKALHEATIALEFASVANRLVLFPELPVRALLVQHGAELVRAASPAWLQPLLDANAKSDGALVATLHAIADANMNVQSAARAMSKHPNTLYARLERIKDVTGLDGRRFRDLTELLLASDCVKI